MQQKIKLLERDQIGYGLLVENDAGIFTYDTKFGNIYESEKNDDKNEYESVYVDCILQRYGVENKNGRIYPQKILEREITKYQKLIDENSAIGEMNHPDTTNITLGNIPHIIKKMWWKGNTLYGTLEIITSPGYKKYGYVSMPGDEICEMIKHKVKLGISSRGVGSVEENDGKIIVQEDFQLICFDLVANPSTHGAYLFPNGIKQETAVQENSPIFTDYTTDKDKKIKEILKNFINF